MTRQQSHQQWTTEAEEQLNTKATLKHILCGECTGLPPEPDQAQQHYITSLRKTISKCNEHSSREDNTNGTRVVKALQAALGAATNVRSHTTVNHEPNNGKPDGPSWLECCQSGRKMETRTGKALW